MVMACEPKQPGPIPLELHVSINWLHPTNKPNHNATLSFFMEDITKLKPILTATATKDEQGRLVWNLTPTGEFTVKSTYKFLNNPTFRNPTYK
jgi:hypothetical protein